MSVYSTVCVAKRHQPMSDLVIPFEALYRDSADDEDRRQFLQRCGSSTKDINLRVCFDVIKSRY